jgi:hypothetical protein
MSEHDKTEPELDLKSRLNLETGKLTWPELQTFFARGIVIVVGPELDLLSVAEKLANDEATHIEQLITNGDLTRANDDHARKWLETDPLFWSVVVSPWVLVQEIREK